MALTSKPTPTLTQVGQYAYFIRRNVPQKAKVIATTTEVANPNNDNAGVVTHFYYLEGFNEKFAAADVFDSAEGLIINLASFFGIEPTFPTSII